MTAPTRSIASAALVAALFSSAGCPGRQVPPTQYYRLVAASCGPEAPAPENLAVLAVDELEIDSTYDDEQIVYRTSDYQLDRYFYHRWSAPPSRLVSETLRLAYADTGRFARVVPALEESQVILRGRIVALEEVDLTPERWIGRLDLELHLEDAQTGEVLWSDRFSEEEPMRQQDPESLARALSVALARVVEQSAPEIAAAAADHVPDLDPAAARAAAGPITCRLPG